jgi:hypothetical protein
MRVSPPTFDVDPSEHRERRPKHDHEKHERVSDVSRQVSHEADDEGTNERRRLLGTSQSMNESRALATTKYNKYTLPYR